MFNITNSDRLITWKKYIYNILDTFYKVAAKLQFQPHHTHTKFTNHD
jgi:hypothetical protein